MINYHIDLGDNDPFNTINPQDPGARKAFYSVTEVTSLLSGSDHASDDNLGLTYDSLSWTPNDFNLNSLKEPGVEISVTNVGTDPSKIEGVVSLVARRDFKVDDELLVYVAIVEEEVTYDLGDPEYNSAFCPIH